MYGRGAAAGLKILALLGRAVAVDGAAVVINPCCWQWCCWQQLTLGAGQEIGEAPPMCLGTDVDAEFFRRFSLVLPSGAGESQI